jgi:type IV secretion system protein VirB5
MEFDKSPNPYLDARREWSERYGHYLVQAKNWRIAAASAFLISLVLALALIISVTKQKVIPYVVEIDKQGNTSAIGVANEFKKHDRKS